MKMTMRAMKAMKQTDKAHDETDRIISSLQDEISGYYRNKKFWRELNVLIDKIYLDDEKATPTQRLKYAEKNGKDKIIKKFADFLVSANEKTVEKINDSQAEIYGLNFKYASDVITEKLKGGD